MGKRPYHHPLHWRSWKFRFTLGLLVLMLLVRLAWGWWIDRKWNALVAAARAKGEPTSYADLSKPVLPESANAWSLQNRAAGLLVRGSDCPRNGDLSYADYPPFPPEWHAAAEASEKAHGPAFAVARQARQLREAQLSPTWTLGPMNVNWSGARELANTLVDGALYKHLKGDDAEASERINDTLHLARSARTGPTLISQLIAIGIDGLACHTTLIIAPGLCVDRGPATRPATRRQVEALITSLLEDEEHWRGFRLGLLGTRAELLEWPGMLEKTNQSPWLTGYWGKAALLRNVEALQRQIDAYDRRSWSEVLAARLPDGKVALVSMDGLVDRHFRILGDRHAAAISLAARLYRADHNRWPSQLSDLVPRYLPSVPVDPFIGQPMGYLIKKTPSGADRPLAYYDAGSDVPEAIGDEPMYQWQFVRVNGRSLPVRRQYRDLSRFTPPPSTQAADNNP